MNIVTEAALEKEGRLQLDNRNTGVGIAFDKVNFGYPDNEKVLHQISFSVDPGSMVLVKGASGSGKSSLLRLLTGAYNQFEGNVMIDGLPIGNYQLTSLRSQTAVLLSQQDIFRGSLLDNLTMGDGSIPLPEIQEVAAVTGLSVFIQSAKQGLDTLLDPL